MVQSRECFDFQTCFFFLPLTSLFWEMRKRNIPKQVINKTSIMPKGQRPFLLLQLACLLLTSPFSLTVHRTLKSFYIFNKIISFPFNPVQENHICTTHNALKNCSIRGEALPMVLATDTSKRHSVRKNSTGVLQKVLGILGHVCLRWLPNLSALTVR